MNRIERVDWYREGRCSCRRGGRETAEGGGGGGPQTQDREATRAAARRDAQTPGRQTVNLTWLRIRIVYVY